MAEVDLQQLVLKVFSKLTLLRRGDDDTTLEVTLGYWKRSTWPNALYALMNVFTFVYLMLYDVMLRDVGCRCTSSRHLSRGHRLCSLRRVRRTYPVISALRVYAITRGKYTVSLATFTFFLGGVIAKILLCVHMYAMAGPLGSACIVVSGKNINLVEVTLRVCNMAAETLVMYTTWKHSYSMWKASRSDGKNFRLTSLLLRDGTVHFSVLYALNVAAVVLDAKQVFRDFSLILYTCVVVVLDIVKHKRLLAHLARINTTLLSHFFLNLRSAARDPSVPSHPPELSGSIRFGRGAVFGSMGGTLSFVSEVELGECHDSDGNESESESLAGSPDHVDVHSTAALTMC
ncbi:uncharacterized protein B0H18DRAFT_1160722 [Fomitopsis serialis]|uniref:uncharacterized protein n=1 Tax=Fomitopsis serialis TaxID=139415 RepID=UPI0020078D51|nr:uncharacterized protein B0H18DRAFT_1160722 [Neoantrodia serialis]KAH9927688.1 hypothetical protein B0H18DRAFT_1160722 [Neoantrodia serialis]